MRWTLLTPIDEPSRAGLMIIGRPRATTRSCALACDHFSRVSSTERGVGRPSASQTRLVMALSMAMLEAITPEPV